MGLLFPHRPMNTEITTVQPSDSPQTDNTGLIAIPSNHSFTLKESENSYYQENKETAANLPNRLVTMFTDGSNQMEDRTFLVQWDPSYFPYIQNEVN